MASAPQLHPGADLLTTWLTGAVLLLAWGAGAFGSPYPWAYTPLLIACAGLGLAGLWLGRRSSAPSVLLTLCLVSLALAVVAQVVPIPTSRLGALSPHAVAILGQQSLLFTLGQSMSHPLSIEPSRTMLGLAFLGGLGLLLLGTARVLTRESATRLAGALVILGASLASRRALTVGYLVFLVIAVVSWVGLDQIAARFAQMDPMSINERPAIWADTIRIAQDFWLTGTGLNTYGVSTLFYQTSIPGQHLREAHNDYLQLAAEGGLLLGIPILLTILAFAWEIRRRLRDDVGSIWWIRMGAVTGLLAIAFQSLGEFSLQMPGNATLFAVIAGLAIHDGRRRARDEDNDFTPLERLLFDCLRNRNQAATLARLKTLSDQEWTALLELADDQMVGPPLRHRLLSPACSPALPDRLAQPARALQQRTAMLNMHMHGDFRRVVRALHERAIPVIVLKGLHLISIVYGDLALRATGDIDLLVPARDLSSAGAVVEALGYVPLAGYHVSPGALSHRDHHLPRFMKAGATPVEMHWHIVDPDSTHPIDVTDLWDRAVPARIAGVDVLVFSPEDLVLHLCLHATYQHLCEFAARPWCDLAETIRRHGETLAWDEIAARAGRWQCRRGTYLALRLAHDLLGAAVPHDVLESLRPAGFDRRILRLATLQRHRNSGLNAPFVEAWSRHTLAGRLRTYWNRIVLPKDQLAQMYNRPRFSRLLYAARLKDLVKRHWRTAIRLQRGQAALTDLDRRSIALRQFLAGP